MINLTRVYSYLSSILNGVIETEQTFVLRVGIEVSSVQSDMTSFRKRHTIKSRATRCHDHATSSFPVDDNLTTDFLLCSYFSDQYSPAYT